MEQIEAFESQIESLIDDRLCKNLLQKSHEEVMDFLGKIKRGEGIGNILTGIKAVDEALMGVCPGMMDVFAAEAGCGKTSLIEMIAIKFLLEGHPILIFQRDMPPFLFNLRLSCRLADVSVSKLRRFGGMNPQEVERVEEASRQLAKTPFFLFSPNACTAKDVKKIAEREAKNSGIKVVIIDHVRSLRHNKNSSWDGLEEISGYIRQSTNETGIPHIALTHVNREGVKSDRPTISHIKGGDQLKDDCDNCCVMWAPNGRPEKATLNQNWVVNFAFDKSRWGWAGIEQMNYNGAKMRFENIKEKF